MNFSIQRAGITSYNTIPDNISFPGISAILAIHEDDWGINDSEAFLVRLVKYSSQTQNSFIRNIAFYGYNDGSVVLHIDYNPGYKDAAKLYFTSLGVRAKDITQGHIHTDNLEQMSTLYNAIVSHNTIDHSKDAIVHALLSGAQWYTVLPHLQYKFSTPEVPLHTLIEQTAKS